YDYKYLPDIKYLIYLVKYYWYKLPDDFEETQSWVPVGRGRFGRLGRWRHSLWSVRRWDRLHRQCQCRRASARFGRSDAGPVAGGFRVRLGRLFHRRLDDLGSLLERG